MEHADAYLDRVRRNARSVRDRIAEAARRGGRDPASVEVVAVTKGHPADAVRAAARAGFAEVGENRVEELERKASEIGGGAGVRWHMIGHVQSRKAARAAAAADLVHSVDSMRLAARLARVGEARERPVPVLVQVNASGEATKGGFAAGTALDDVAAVAALPGLRVRGLMTMAPLTADEATLRSTFRALRRVMADAASLPGVAGRELSMGMSNDFEIAVEEGATLLRLGTVLMGPRPS